ncbi:hypothetical protein ACFX13_021885 [Malus domestica]
MIFQKNFRITNQTGQFVLVPISRCCVFAGMELHLDSCARGTEAALCGAVAPSTAEDRIIGVFRSERKCQFLGFSGLIWRMSRVKIQNPCP